MNFILLNGKTLSLVTGERFQSLCKAEEEADRLVKTLKGVSEIVAVEVRSITVLDISSKLIRLPVPLSPERP